MHKKVADLFTMLILVLICNEDDLQIVYDECSDDPFQLEQFAKVCLISLLSCNTLKFVNNICRKKSLTCSQ